MPVEWHLLFYEWRWKFSVMKMSGIKTFLNCYVQKRFAMKFICAITKMAPVALSACFSLFCYYSEVIDLYNHEPLLLL